MYSLQLLLHAFLRRAFSRLESILEQESAANQVFCILRDEDILCIDQVKIMNRVRLLRLDLPCVVLHAR